MSVISLLLQNVHEIVHDFRMKPKFSEPKIFTGGVDPSQWSRLTKLEQKKALDAEWYVYYSFQDPTTGKLKRQPNIKAGANRYKTKKQRYDFLKVMQSNLSILLNRGFDPYQSNNLDKEEILEELFGTDNNPIDSPKPKAAVSESFKTIVTIKEAIDLGLDTKKKILAESTYPKFKSRINQFNIWLNENGFLDTDNIQSVKKTNVIKYLNFVLQKTSPRNRNNTRADLGSLFQVLEDNDIIGENFVKKINVLKSIPVRNKTYTPLQESDILKHMKSRNQTLLLFVKFISYNFLRPIEVCRLRVADVDVIDKKLYFRAKNTPVKVKIIPEKLLKELPDLSNLPKKNFLFTPDGIGQPWDASDTSRRDHFSKEFKKVKDHFKLGAEYGLYSFRHTFITKLYREFAKTLTPHEAKSKLLLITGHSTFTALESYLRDIDAVLPEDYSKYIK